MGSRDVHDSPLGRRLRAAAEASRDVTAPYRLARLVARVLVSTHLRQREKWCGLAECLAADPMVEDRLVHQAIGWLRLKPLAPDTEP